ncbi:MAG: CHAT domain-containing protein [Gemmatimonadota bacterium]|nr:CHAT domain-containing protein [Gemmatimonadota bacterium]
MPRAASAPDLMAVVAACLGLAACAPDERESSSPAFDLAAGSAPRAADELAGLTADSVFALAMRRYDLSEYDSASALLLAAERRAIETEDVATRADALTWLGNAARHLGDYETSREVGEEALDLKLNAGLEGEVWRSYNALGLLAWWEARFTDAIELFDLALLSAAEAPDADPLAVAKAENNRGLVHFDLGNFDRAAEGFERLRRVGETVGAAREQAEGLSNLGMLDVAIGDPHAAIRRLREARGIFASIDDPDREQIVLGHLGSAYLLLGDAGRARAAYDTALLVSRRHGLRVEEAQNLELLAAFFSLAGDQRRALRYYDDAREINLALGDDLYAGIDLRNEAVTYAELGELQVARQRALEALQLHEPLDVPVPELRDRLVLAEIAGRQGDEDEVDRQLAAAAHLVERLGTETHRVETALTTARLADAAGDSRGVLRVLANIGPLDYATDWEVESLRARASLRLDDLVAAVRSGEAAVSALERVRGTLGSAALRTTFTASRTRTYADLVTALLRSGDSRRAFVIADAARGRGLVEHLASAPDDSGDSLTRGLAEGQRILRRVNRLSAALSGEAGEIPPAETKADLSALLREARAEYEDHLLRMAETDPRRVAALGLEHLALSDIQAVLEPGQVLLEYLVTPERVVAFIVTPDGIETFESQIDETNLTSRIRVTRGLLSQPDMRDEDAEGMLRELYDLLFEPAARMARLHDAVELIVVPHGALTYLPFGALRDPVTGRYLIERYAISYVPSAAALPHLRRDGVSVAARVRADGVNVFVPDPAGLPGSRDEAMAIAEAVEGAAVFSGESATESSARAGLAAPGAFHVAGHAALTPENPLFSWIELADGGGPDHDADGRLEVHEVLQISVNSPLIFLSGCETGVRQRAWSSRLVQGEDYVTLAQAFLHSGARSVVATLWRVEDGGAAAFAAEFYRALADGAVTAAEAVATAQRVLLAGGRYASPYHWAAYRANG